MPGVLCGGSPSSPAGARTGLPADCSRRRCGPGARLTPLAVSGEPPPFPSRRGPCANSGKLNEEHLPANPCVTRSGRAHSKREPHSSSACGHNPAAAVPSVYSFPPFCSGIRTVRGLVGGVVSSPATQDGSRQGAHGKRRCVAPAALRAARPSQACRSHPGLRPPAWGRAAQFRHQHRRLSLFRSASSGARACAATGRTLSHLHGAGVPTAAGPRQGHRAATCMVSSPAGPWGRGPMGASGRVADTPVTLPPCPAPRSDADPELVRAMSRRQKGPRQALVWSPAPKSGGTGEFNGAIQPLHLKKKNGCGAGSPAARVVVPRCPVPR